MISSVKKRKEYQCPVCSQPFIKMKIGQKTCLNPRCALTYSREQSAQKAKAEETKKLKIRKLEVKPLSWFAKKAQKAFNEFIRERDRNEPCISCQRHHSGQYHAGHYKTVGAKSELRFNEDNCHKQCSVCNNHLSGNLAEYRINLINKIGIKRVEALESHNEPVKHGREDYEQIEKHYKKKLKELRSEAF